MTALTERPCPVSRICSGVARPLLAFALAATVTACGGSDPTVPGPPAAGTANGATVAAGATLLGSVGTKAEPNSFVIALTDSAGAPVTTVPAGSYTIKVMDYAEIHDFVLSGDGVDEETDVAGTGESTFQVTLKPGTYTYKCGPHPSMNGSFTVT